MSDGDQQEPSTMVAQASGDADEVDQPTQGEPDHSADRKTLATQVDLLAEENKRLRNEYRRARQARYKQTAYGLAFLGVLALGGALVFPAVQAVLLALSGIGLFGAILVRTLSPERFIAESVGERVYEAHAENGDALITDLGLSSERLYVPTSDGVTLYIPQRELAEIPNSDELERPFIVDEEHRGLALSPTGGRLFGEFERDLAGEPSTSPGTLGDQLVEGLVEAFELIDSGTVGAEPGRLSFEIEDPAYGDVDEFDHPVASFLAVGIAATLDEPVSLDIETEEQGDEAIVTCRWDVSEERVQ